MNGLNGFRSLDRHSDPRKLTGDLTDQISTLRRILESVGEEPRLMDASLDDTHEIASRAGRLVKYEVFAPDGPLPASVPPDIQCQFELVRAEESDVYEVYADDLERHQKRQRKDLTIADSDADKLTVVKRRRTYIVTLFDFYKQISEIVDQLAAQ
jgi:hypothetical protein